ncbi:hypothetical protein [Nocardioides sp.]|jgi:hypothetical protein|uniref:hypothetical protein n=1 Tax=Nocardioides sp. TaxID=35761 RepID=UPI002F420B57
MDAVDEQPDGQRDDRVLAYTRGLSLFIVPFLLVAFVILYLFPDHTARLWSWHIAVSMTSMVLASAYLGGAYFFLRVARSRHWHEVGTGFLAVTAFASLLGVATLLHWDLFLHDHLAFWLWAGLYFTAPFLVIGAWLANRRYGAPAAAGDVLLRPLERWVVAVVGLLALGTGVVLFLAPGAMNDLWPWPLTPLTGRVIGATFCLGGAGVGVWFDPRWTSVRVMLQVESVMLVLMLIAAVRARDELIGSHALAWPLLLGTLLVLAGSAYLWLTYEHHPRPAPGPRGLDELGRRGRAV